MREAELEAVEAICARCGNARDRIMDIIVQVQSQLRGVGAEAMDRIAELTGARRVEVESAVSFYHFLSAEPKGRIVIRLCDDIIDRMFGFEKVAKAIKAELGIGFGQTTEDGLFSLERTACIGMCDQAPGALVNEVVVTKLTSDSARRMVCQLREHGDPRRLVAEAGDGNNAHPLVQAMVRNNVRMQGPVVFADFHRGEALKRALGISPVEVIRSIKTARLRGRGGAGFPTGMKWEFTRAADGERKFVICNADEGEPGTFKDRVILTERPHMMIEGMTIAGYALGAQEGIIYLRGEYAYLLPFLNEVVEQRRRQRLLGPDILEREGFSFDVRIQLGAGAYVCGEETALISSCEGRRGDPKNRPPFPAQKGYLGQPTVVNNVETFCKAAKILEKGPAWFAQYGTGESPGTKLLSVSGDCSLPGVFEVPFGIRVGQLLEFVGATDAVAVQIGGPSGQLIGKQDFDRTICYEDLSTGGSVMIFDSRRNLAEVVQAFMRFFVDESCGYCTPCRVGNVLLAERFALLAGGRARASDVQYMRELGQTIKTASRCGLGQTSPNPVLSFLDNFPALYEPLLRPEDPTYQPAFDMGKALSEAAGITDRQPVLRTK